jgi:ABC-type transport system involved in multi-copper enzyme maturation permease subunit
MFAAVLRFELAYHLKSRLFLFGCLIFFLLAFLGVASPNVQFGSLGGANYNSPLALLQSQVAMAMIGVLVGAAFLNSAALRDTDQRMAEIIYSTRVTRAAYVFGRFIGAFTATYLVYLVSFIGFATGALMPWLDPDLVGPFVMSHYLYSAVAIGLPALFANSVIVYALALLTRDQRIAYAGIIGLLVLYQVAAAMLGQLDYRVAAALVDPTGTATLAETMQYWTVFERNTELAPLAGLLLANRILWLAIGLALLVATYLKFDFVLDARRARRRESGDGDSVALPLETRQAVVYTGRQPAIGYLTGWLQFRSRVAFEVRGVVRSVFFWVLVALAGALMMGNFFALEQIYGTRVYPVTRSLLQIMSGTVTLSLMIIAVFYGADLVWRDREARFQEILGATPTPSWAFLLAKIAASLLVVLVFLLVTAAIAVIYQAASGYSRFELDLYLVRYLYDYASIFYFMVVLSVFVQVVVPNKYVGMLLMVVYILAVLSLPNAGWEDPLYLYGTKSSTPYSDMNGYDGLLLNASWYVLYWGCFTVVLCVLGYALWSRGPLETLRTRAGSILDNLTAPAAVIAAAGALGFAGAGAWIFYNTHVLNEYRTSDDLRAFTAAYESRYRHLKGQPIPRFTDVDISIDLYPGERAFTARGNYVFENRTGVEIEQLPVGFGFLTRLDSVEIEGATLIESDPEFNVHRFRFEPPLAAGERRKLSFAVSRTPRGFLHRNVIPSLLNGGGVFSNGTFVNNQAFAPYLGYNEGLILTDRNDRWREGLEPVPRRPDLDDETYWRTGFLPDSDWVNFRATVTTADDQVAIAPGYLVEETRQGNRRRFVYEMDAPMQNFFAVLSGRYETRVEERNGVQLAVYHHPAHDWNVDRMIQSLRDSIDFFGEIFDSPYQYRQMRVIEFPAYESFAQSFPNTVPWSESIGFIADISDPADIDYVYYVGAHEVAHQWWGHQVSAASVQGGSMIIETLAQYSALMLMEREYGPHVMRRFLKYELDRYLSSRGSEAIEELPLYRVEGQGYIHYRKGSIAMYALKDYLGIEAINAALAGFVASAAYRSDPYPRSRELVRLLREQARSDSEQLLITDMLEKITLWDLSVDNAEVTERDDGRFDVSIAVAAAKYYADGEGRQTEAPLDMPIDIGLFSSDPDEATAGDAHVLLLEKHRVKTGAATYRFTVDERPSHVGLDPYNKLIDRNSDDNLKAL